MKKTQFIELISVIKSTLVSFISICMFVCLSVAIFVGISWTSSSISQSVDDLVDNTNFHDAELVFPYGYSSGDIDSLLEMDGVDEAEGLYSSYEFFVIDDNRYQAVIYELPNKIDTLIDVVGELPKKSNQIGVDEHFARIHNIKIGDKIQFESNKSKLSNVKTILEFDEENDDSNSLVFNEDIPYLNNNEFTVTSLIKSSRYLSHDEQCYGVSPVNQLSINTFMYVDRSAFNEDAYCGYTSILLKNHKFDSLKTFSNEYIDTIENYSKDLNTVLTIIDDNKNTLINNKIDIVVNKADKELGDADLQIKNAEKTISTNNKKLKDAKKQLDEALLEIKNSTEEVEDAKKQLEEKESQYNSLKSTYLEIRAKNSEILDRNDFVTYLNDNGYFDKIIDLCYKYGGEIVKNAVSSLIDQLIFDPINKAQEFVDTIDSYVSNYDNQIADAHKRIDAATYLIEVGKIEYEQKLNEYNNGLRSITNATNKLQEERNEYDAAIFDYDIFKQEVNEFKDGKTSILYRNQNSGLMVCETLTQMYDKLRFSMAGLFVVVGLLVCYSAISRIVNDQSKAIGTKKALGLNSKEITLFYLAYTSIALIVGCLLGSILGYLIVENIFVVVLNQNFANNVRLYFGFKECIAISLLEIVLLLLTTLIACRNVLKRNAIMLLQGQTTINAKKRFFEKWEVWNNMSLLTKTIINNFFNDSRRVFGTLIGIAGSTALIVTAFTFNNNFMNSFKYQYDNVFNYKYIISYKGNRSKGPIKDYLINNNIESTEIYKTRMFIKGPDDIYMPTHFYVINDLDSFKNFVNIIPYKSKDSTPYEGLWLGSSYSNFYNSKVGDEAIYVDISGNEYKTNISGYFNHYLANHFSIIDKNTYREVFNDEITCNSLLINGDGVDLDELKRKLDTIDGFISLEDFYSSSKNSFDVFENLSRIMVIVYASLSVVMAFLVLLNLLSMFVDEKKNELIVLMINGFSLKDGKRYIYSDTIFLTVIGIIFGIFIGTFVGNLSVKAFETSKTIVLKGFDLQACIIGVIGSVLLTFIVSHISLKKINKFKLTDIHKA